MQEKDPEQLKYLELLSEKFPTTQAAFTEIVNLEAMPQPAQGHRALCLGRPRRVRGLRAHSQQLLGRHPRARGGGSILELTASEQADLCTLVYYPAEKLRRLREEGTATSEWYAITRSPMRLVRLARRLSGSYTRSKVRKAMPVAYAYIIDELLHISPDERETRLAYHQRIIEHDHRHWFCGRLHLLACGAHQAPGRGPHAPGRRHL